jgi:hypothetical protein
MILKESLMYVLWGMGYDMGLLSSSNHVHKLKVAVGSILCMRCNGFVGYFSLCAWAV